MSNSGGSMGPGGSGPMNRQRVAEAVAKANTPAVPQAYPLPAPVRRQALTAAIQISPAESRTAALSRKISG